jgi:hypothetical protein
VSLEESNVPFVRCRLDVSSESLDCHGIASIRTATKLNTDPMLDCYYDRRCRTIVSQREVLG